MTALGRKRYQLAVIVLGLAVVAVFSFFAADDNYQTIDFAETKYYAQQACALCYEAVRELYGALLVKTEVQSWHFYVLVAIILLWERTKPVYSGSRTVGVSFFHDFLWFLLNALFVGLLIPVYQTLLFGIYHSYLSTFRIDLIRTWPVIGQIVLAVLVSDFIRWLHHLLRHKVILFWYFHTVHHSQRDMNLFTDLRVHPVERLIEAAVAFIPFMSLTTDIALASLGGWHMFGIWYARFYHSNIKTNLGILHYIMVTPQSHRIHHSRLKEHQDKNFGAIFSIWDHLFRTQYRGYDEYPETGLADPEFPLETELGWRQTIRTVLQQLAYPFQLTFISALEMIAKRQPV
jgi:sterol desaturase/sphingolipid hydroxylase (fatty acid hydroxylase superfamily)